MLGKPNKKAVTPKAMTKSIKSPRPRPGILDIENYEPGESTVPARKTPVKLSSNETPLGPSPAAVAAAQSVMGELNRYPDGTARALREAIAGRYGIDADRIVCTSGSDEALALLARAYLGPGDEAIYSEHGFLVYRIAILSCSATPVVAPECDLRTDVDAILNCVTDKTRMVFIANPNNPTGTYIAIEEVRRLRANLPDGVVLVLDGAYAEYVHQNDYEAGLELVATTQNTIMTRTFSKIYGLAALRLGWAYCPEPVADVLNRIRGPFNVTGPSIAAGIGAIQDQAHVDRAIAHNDKWLPWLTKELQTLGLNVTPSVANFILIHFPGGGTNTAAAADTYLKSHGIILRRVENYGLPNALRMSIGTEKENRVVVSKISEFLASKSAAQGMKTDGGLKAQ